MEPTNKPFSGVMTTCPVCLTKDQHRTCYDKVGPRMIRTCNTCSYRWEELPANAGPRPPTEDDRPPLLKDFVTQDELLAVTRKLVNLFGLAREP